MSILTRENPTTKRTFAAVARHFRLLAKVFASRTTRRAPVLTARQPNATFKALARASPADLIAIDNVLKEIINAIDRRARTTVAGESRPEIND